MVTNLEEFRIDIQDTLKVEIKKVTIIEKLKRNIDPLYIFLSVYLLMPILSIESLFVWSIAGSCAYKTIKIYSSEENNKCRKAIMLQMIALVIIVAFNLLVYYGVKTLVAKLV